MSEEKKTQRLSVLVSDSLYSKLSEVAEKYDQSMSVLERRDIVPDVLSGLNESGQVTLKLFYTASVFLQQVHEDQLKERVPHWRTFPDYFSEELDVPGKENLLESKEGLSSQLAAQNKR
ncbi:MAG: hypothetical protein R6U51_08120 [Anaerolineales bacterium]